MCEVIAGIKEESRAEGIEQERQSAILKMIHRNFTKETIISLGYTEEEFSKAAENYKSLRSSPSRMEL